jgi:Tol biopolymer transport system component
MFGIRQRSRPRVLRAAEDAARELSNQPLLSCSVLVLVLALVADQESAGGGERSTASDAIIFERKGDLYAVAVDGPQTIQLTKSRTLELEPAVSPNGDSIAYVRRSARRYEPHYSPRRERDLWEAFVDLTGGEVWTMRVDGSRRMRITRGARDVGPAWSSGGEMIFFSRAVKAPYWEPCRTVFIVRKDGRELRPVTRVIRGGGPGRFRNFFHAPRDLAVSPGGRRIAFTDRVTCETTDVLPYLNVVDTHGRRTSDLARQPEVSTDAGNANPTWSPDGSRVAFHRTSVRSGRPASQGYGGIYVADRTGSGVRRITPRTRTGHSPAWSPDGAWIAFVGRGDLYLIHPDGTGLRQITRTKSRESSPAWFPRMPSG